MRVVAPPRAELDGAAAALSGGVVMPRMRLENSSSMSELKAVGLVVLLIISLVDNGALTAATGDLLT